MCKRPTGKSSFIKESEIGSLCDSIGRCNVEAITIPRIQQDVDVLSLMTGLKEGYAFRSYLGHNTVTSLGLVLGKENEYLRGEEFDKAASSQHRG